MAQRGRDDELDGAGPLRAARGFGLAAGWLDAHPGSRKRLARDYASGGSGWMGVGG